MGYWQVHLHESSQDITAFFTPEGKMRWNVMPMGFLNSMSIFCTIIDFIKQETNHRAASKNLIDDVSVTFCDFQEWTQMKGIVDNVILHSESEECLFQYLEFS